MNNDNPSENDLKDYRSPSPPDVNKLSGQYVDLERIDLDNHCEELFESFRHDSEAWKYLSYGPYHSYEDYYNWWQDRADLKDPYFLAVRDLSCGKVKGILSFLRINTSDGSIEVGHINFSQTLRGTRASTESIYLVRRWVFENGYRRFEWKCNSRNARSRNAAMKFGFSFEGVFRQAKIERGINRDTAWYACIDKEWADLNQAYQSYLQSNNFDDEGKPRIKLSDLTSNVIVKRG